jgi:hypothetical protein
MRLNEATWLVVDELTADWEELRERWTVVVTPGGKEKREARMISPAELEAKTWAQYGFDDIDSYYADGYGFQDAFQTVALRTAIESVDWTQVIEQLEKGRKLEEAR